MTNKAIWRYPRSMRSGGTALLSIILAVLVLSLPSCRPVEQPTQRPLPSLNTPKHSKSSATLCEADRVKCGAVNVDTLGSVTYAIVSPSNQPSDLVLYEPGGPGSDVFGRASPDFLSLPAEMRSHDVLLIRDPWGGRAISQKCTQVIGELLNPTNSDRDAAALFGDHGECPRVGWTGKRYAEAVKQVLAAENRHLAGAIGESYGALLAHAASSSTPGSWLVINAPAAPGHITSGQRLTQQRIDAMDGALDRSYQRECKNLKADCGRRGSALARESAASLTNPVTVPGRSQTISSHDMGLAVLSASYNLEQNGPWLWRNLLNIRAASTQDLLNIGRFADQVIRRFGAGEVSNSLGSYFAGMCLGYSGWSEPAAVSPSDPGWLLWQVGQVCTKAAISGVAGFTAPVKRTRLEACVYVNDLDPVSSTLWGLQWAERLGVKPLRYSVETHAGLAALPSGKCSFLRDGKDSNG